jgi:hypothetical protein
MLALAGAARSPAPLGRTQFKLGRVRSLNSQLPEQQSPAAPPHVGADAHRNVRLLECV